MMKRMLRSLTVLVCGMLVCCVALAGVVDKVIVVVNDEVITQREFDRAFIPLKQSIEANFKGDEIKEKLAGAKTDLMEMLVDTKLAISLARKNEVEIDQKELDGRLEKIKSYYKSEDEFLKALNAKGTNLTEFERELSEQMLAQELVRQEVGSKIIVTPAEVRDLYEKNKEQLIAPLKIKARGIMVRKKQDTDNADAKKKIKEIAAEAKKGKDFGKLAREKSEGPFAGNGGDMGYIVQGQMLKEMDQALFSMKEGEISDIVETDVGYHVLLVEEIQQPRPFELAEVNDFLKDQLYKKKFQENLVEWLKEQRKNAYISYK